MYMREKIMRRYAYRQIFWSWLVALNLLVAFAAGAQESSSAPESLQMPEVVITGIDRTVIQRALPKVEPNISAPVVTLAIRDLAEKMMQDGDVVFFTKPQQAEQHYKDALTLDPNYSMAYVRLGDAKRALLKYEAAADAYQQALGVAKDVSDAHYRLGILYETHLEMPQKAREHYQAYQESHGEDQRVRIWMRKIDRQLTGE